HALAVLVGEQASQFTLDPQTWSTALPAIPPGVPATVLARRPDVAAAQSSLLAAQARVGVAQAAWFPSLALTGAGGFASPELRDARRIELRNRRQALQVRSAQFQATVVLIRALGGDWDAPGHSGESVRRTDIAATAR